MKSISQPPRGAPALPVVALARQGRFLPSVRVAALAVAAFLAHSGWGWGQTPDDLARCRAITEDPRRLACYDAIQLSPSAPRSKYEPVALAELKTYALSYRGRLVDVSGWIRPERNFYLLGATVDDPSPLPVDLRVLGRRERDQIIERCAAGCEVAIQGRVGPVNFVTGIVAETVLVR